MATSLAGRRAPLCPSTKAVTAAATATSTSLQLLLGSLLEGLGLPIPAELLLITAPVAGLAGGPAFALATGGYLAGAAGAYWGGQRGGARAIERIAGIAGMGPAEGDRLGALFRRWGPLMGLVGRFLPPVRAASLWAAGALRIEPRLYFSAVALSTLLYNGLWLAAGLSVAHRLERVFGWFNWLGGGVLLTLLLIRVVRLVRTRQGRGGLW